MICIDKNNSHILLYVSACIFASKQVQQVFSMWPSMLFCWYIYMTVISEDGVPNGDPEETPKEFHRNSHCVLVVRKQPEHWCFLYTWYSDGCKIRAKKEAVCLKCKYKHLKKNFSSSSKSTTDIYPSLSQAFTQAVCLMSAQTSFLHLEQAHTPSLY